MPDVARFDKCHFDYTWFDVFRNDWNALVKAFEQIGVCGVTKRKLSLGVRDSTTGWKAKTWTESTIQALIIPKGSTHMNLPAGSYVRSDLLLFTRQGLDEGDEVLLGVKYYEVKAVREHWQGAPNMGGNFCYREADLTYLPFHE